jgi:glc operon protein GlcG
VERQDLIRKADVGLDLARALVEAARAEADRLGLAIAAAVVDSGGQLVEAVRMDGAQLCAMPLAMDKAYTAVACGLPTAAWATRTQPGQADWGLNTALGGRLIAFAGGIPLYSGSILVGGLGISGAAAHQDEAVAEAAVSALGLTAYSHNDPAGRSARS